MTTTTAAAGNVEGPDTSSFAATIFAKDKDIACTAMAKKCAQYAMVKDDPPRQQAAQRQAPG